MFGQYSKVGNGSEGELAAVNQPYYLTAMHVHVEKTRERPTVIAVRDDGVSLRVRAPDRKFSPTAPR